MTKKKNRGYLLIVGVLAILALTMGATLAFAQGSEDPQVPTEELTTWLPYGQGGRWGFRAGEIDYDALLAEALGITVEELQAARDEAHVAALVQAVAEGLITQNQADLMLARRTLRTIIDHDELLAGVLGVSIEELQTARQEGSLPDLIAGLDLAPAEVREAMRAAYAEAVQQAVDEGLIELDPEQLDELLNGEGFGFRRLGPGRGFGGHGFPGAGPGAGGFQFGASFAPQGSGV